MGQVMAGLILFVGGGGRGMDLDDDDDIDDYDSGGDG